MGLLLKLALPSFVVVLLGMTANACGGGEATRSRPSALAGQSDYSDGDGDVGHKDDRKILGYGEPADAAEQRMIEALFKRYYAIAVRHDGAVACSLISLRFLKRILSGYGKERGRPPRRGESCATVMSKLLVKRRYMSAIEAVRLRVIGARVAGDKGYVLLRFATLTPETLYMPIRRESSVWKMEALFGLALL